MKARRRSKRLFWLIVAAAGTGIVLVIPKARLFLIVLANMIIHDPKSFVIPAALIVGGALGFWFSRIKRRFGNPNFIYISNSWLWGIFPLPLPGAPAISLFIMLVGIIILMEMVGVY